MHHGFAWPAALAASFCSCLPSQSYPTGAPWNDPGTTARAGHDIAALRGWDQFERQALIPCKVIEDMVVNAQPPPLIKIDPQALCALNRSEVRPHVERLQRNAAGPLFVTNVTEHRDDDMPYGTRAFKVRGTYRTRDGGTQDVTMKLIWRNSRFWITYL